MIITFQDIYQGQRPDKNSALIAKQQLSVSGEKICIRKTIPTDKSSSFIHICDIYNSNNLISASNIILSSYQYGHLSNILNGTNQGQYTVPPYSSEDLTQIIDYYEIIKSLI